MSGNEYINDVSGVVLETIGVGSFVLDSAVKKYIKRKEGDRISKIILKHDLSLSSDELIEISIQDLISKKVIIRSGKSIRRPSETRNLNHQTQETPK